VIYAYALFAKWANIEFTLPRISLPEKLSFIPTEREIDNLVAASTKYIALFLQICKETAARSGEVSRLRWTDVDFENASVRITPERDSKPRLAKLSNKAIQMLNQLNRNHETLFIGHYKNSRTLLRTFLRQRKRIAAKMGNPRLQQIHFHTLRHWKATTEYHKTKDILHVMQMLGHRRIQNTLKYTQLVQFDDADAYVCKVTKNDKEIAVLIEAGFQYVCENDGLKFFRKPK
jgi:integrase